MSNECIKHLKPPLAQTLSKKCIEAANQSSNLGIRIMQPL